ncbi:MAG: 23S rRNA (guanosine(2251)-2'-O)-methyltransferase RlmB [Actinobacteria bacterium]|nr:23S rRNA (guanosine(2251)-2'-O)-methyltransferase RlmB [Actinomycetota bacterium]
MSPPPRRRQPPPKRPPARRPSAPAGAGLGGEQVEGRRAVRELLAGSRPVRELLVAQGAERSPIVQEILDLAVARRVTVRRVSLPQLDGAARTDAPQGVVARAQALPEADLDDLARRSRGGPQPFLVVLDGVTDPHNLGAVLRSAEVAGATGAVLPRHRAAHVSPAAAKAAAGAIEHVPMALVPGTAAALAQLKEAGVWVVGLDMAGPQSVFELELATEPVALVLGAEGAGLSRLVRERCDVLVAIPQRGRLGSLNVAAAAAVACFEVSRRRPG